MNKYEINYDMKYSHDIVVSAKNKSEAKKETYEFGIKEHKDLGYKAVVLADDTHIVLGKEVTIMYPKKKFIPIFKEQMKDKKRAYIGVSFSKIELEAIMKGIEMLGGQ